jgi:hypothetical protein
VATVYLHIGAFKTGTSFIQQVLGDNADVLKRHGVLWPGGGGWGAQVQAVQGLQGIADVPYSRWTDLVDEINAWDGDRVLVSMEFLSFATPEQIETAVTTLAGHKIRIVLALRDLGRVLPAQWQESVQNGFFWDYREYVAAAASPQARVTRPGRYFWSKHDWPRILRRWQKHLSSEDMIVVTVPPAGSSSGLLWERFCAAVDLPAEEFVMPPRANESLGAVSAEVMRRVAKQADRRGIDRRTQEAIKWVLSKDILASQKGKEPALLLPIKHQGWAKKRSKKIIEELRGFDPVVVGDLDDLMPTFPPLTPDLTVDPASLPSEDVLEKASYALVLMAERIAKLRK